MLEKKQPKNKSVSTKITEDQLKKLDELAEKEGMTRSNLINQLLASGFVKETRFKNF